MAIGRGIGRGLRGYGQSVVDPNTRRASGSSTFSTFTASGSADAAKSASGSATFDTFTGAGSGTVGSASPITIDLQASRTTGVAPLSVFFNATGTTSTGVTRTFHRLGFELDFDDPTSPLPTSTGACSAHVFDAPGTYTVSLTVKDENGNTANVTVDITATDPDVVFAGTATVCFSTDGDFTGAPSGCTQVTTSSVATAMTHAGAGKRLLFKRGQTFIANGTGFDAGVGPMIVGAFGTGTSPDARGIYANDPIFSVQAGAEDVQSFPFRGNDFRVCNITMVEGDAFAFNDVGFDADRTTTHALVYRCKTTGLRTSAGFSQDLIQTLSLDPHENATMAFNHWEDSRVTTTYCGGRNLAFLGNWYDTNVLSHLCRITWAQRGVVDGNIFDFPGTDRHCVKLHAAQDTALFGDYTEQVVIRNNTMHAGVPWMVTCGAQGNDVYELVRDVLIEQNLFLADTGSQSPVFIHCYDVTARNNLIVSVNGNGGLGTYAGFLVDENGITPYPSGIEIYNNTQHDHTGGGNETAILEIRKYAAGETLLLYNNILDVDAGNSWAVYPGWPAASQVDSQSNLRNLTFNFVNPATYDFTPGAGSAALGAGVAVPTFYDFLGLPRSHDDVGAFERA